MFRGPRIACCCLFLSVPFSRRLSRLPSVDPLTPCGCSRALSRAMNSLTGVRVSQVVCRWFVTQSWCFHVVPSVEEDCFSLPICPSFLFTVLVQQPLQQLCPQRTSLLSCLSVSCTQMPWFTHTYPFSFPLRALSSRVRCSPGCSRAVTRPIMLCLLPSPPSLFLGSPLTAPALIPSLFKAPSFTLTKNACSTRRGRSKRT